MWRGRFDGVAFEGDGAYKKATQALALGGNGRVGIRPPGIKAEQARNTSDGKVQHARHGAPHAVCCIGNRDPFYAGPRVIAK